MFFTKLLVYKGCNPRSFLIKIMLISSFIFSVQQHQAQVGHSAKPIPAANQTEAYLKLLKNKKIALVTNQTSVLPNGSKSKYTHLVDTLLSLGIDIVKVFAPEHGFRGKLDAGEQVKDQKDPLTNLPIISLYGKNKKPGPEQLKGVELILFDIQDVGVRFYTYISTLHYVMQACAEQNIPLVLLDRPNPNGHYIDGPVREKEFKSFVGMHPVPVVYGMTIGEYGQMINGEGWLEEGLVCDLAVIPLASYTHQSIYELPILPSPNLPNSRAINLYPSLCFFEGTTLSCGRGTEMQFQVFGSPDLPQEQFSFSFTPAPNFGSKHPKHEGKTCYGKDLRKGPYLNHLNLEWLLEAYANYPDPESFFNDFFSKLAGTDELRKNIESGLSASEIRKLWQAQIEDFKKVRLKYLIYE